MNCLKFLLLCSVSVSSHAMAWHGGGRGGCDASTIATKDERINRAYTAAEKQLKEMSWDGKKEFMKKFRKAKKAFDEKKHDNNEKLLTLLQTFVPDLSVSDYAAIGATLMTAIPKRCEAGSYTFPVQVVETIKKAGLPEKEGQALLAQTLDIIFE